MSPRSLQYAALHLYRSNPSPIFKFLLAERTFSTCSQCLRRHKHQHLEKIIWLPKGVFLDRDRSQSRPKIKLEPDNPTPETPELVADAPPTRKEKPYLRIIMPPGSEATLPSSRLRTYRPDMSKSTLSSSEKELFAKIFDEMLTAPARTPGGRGSMKHIRRAVNSREMKGASKKMGISAALLDDEVFLTAEEAAEYPPGLRSLAARLVKEEEGIKEGDWAEVQRAMDECESEVELLSLLDSKVLSVMRGENVELKQKLREVYPQLLLKGIKLLRLNFGKPLLAITLFLRVKGISAESYVLGCTTPMYNELLRARWVGFSDLGSVMDILEEMSSNGLKGDAKTVQILKRIQDDVQEWMTEGNELLQVIWKDERHRLNKLDKIHKEMFSKLEEEARQEEVVKGMDLMTTEVQGQGALSPAETR